MAEEVPEEKFHAAFERLNDLKNLQNSLLKVDLFHESNEDEHRIEGYNIQNFAAILSEYQEQSYLLDPFLEQLVTPAVECLKSYAKKVIEKPSEIGSYWRVNRLCQLLYNYVKFRGHKTIIRFFPHEIADLSIVLDYIQIPNGHINENGQWALRYVLLLWLYIICIIPFDLAQFDDPEHAGRTADSLQTFAKSNIGKAGLERDGATLLLSRLYIRKDTGSGFHDFVKWSLSFLPESNDVITAIGLLQVLCEVVKSGSAEQVQSELNSMMSILRTLKESSVLSINTLVRKYNTKLVSRIGLRLLPGASNLRRRKARTLLVDELSNGAEESEEIDVPEELEDILEQLLAALQDKDTIVRWSAAKGIARIAERLPQDFANQVLETILGLFEIHSIAAASLYDLPAIAEGTWHGACLACAEIARRSLVEPLYLPKLIEWLSKALYFDLRKGAHSIGSNVRDAAAYVLWALARTQNQAALVPHATNLAQRLTAVALFDREVHIRRAASAAYQEHVGRNSLFPHGIDVLGKTDFYAVSIRKHAFLVAAPQVAEHAEYRRFLVDHLLDVVIRHWDLQMREVGSQSLRLICAHDLDGLAPVVIDKSARLLDSLDSVDVHGGLSALCEISIAYKDVVREPGVLEARLRDVFKHLNRIPETALTVTRNELIATAACRLIANSITLTEINLGENASAFKWKRIVEICLKHRDPIVQGAAADAMSHISNLENDMFLLFKLIVEMRRGSPVMQQGLARLLSVIHYDNRSSALPNAINYLLDRVKPASNAVVETRRSCFQAMPRILALVSPHLTSWVSSDVVNALVDALLNGLDDYTIDERGDVGSWVRIACIQGLTAISELLFRVLGAEGSTAGLESYFPHGKYHAIAAGILKQGVERLDNVRHEAGICFMKLLNAPLPPFSGIDRWRLPGLSLLNELFQSASEESGWNDGTWLFPRAMRLLEIPEYRNRVLSGIVISIGSKTDSIQRPVASSFVKFAQGLPLVAGPRSDYSKAGLVSDLINHAKAHMTSNAVVIPVYQTFTQLFEADVLRQLPDEASGLQSLKTLLHMSSQNVDKMKSVQRIHESMKIVVNLLSFEKIRNEKGAVLANFLAHPFPRVRADTAEYLYVLLQSADLGFETESIEELLLETEWSTEDIAISREAANDVVRSIISQEA